MHTHSGSLFVMHLATHCSALQYTAIHCSKQQYIAAHNNIGLCPMCAALFSRARCCERRAEYYNTFRQRCCARLFFGIQLLLRTAAHCNELQCTTTHCITLQQRCYARVCVRTNHTYGLQHTAICCGTRHCSTLQHTAPTNCRANTLRSKSKKTAKRRRGMQTTEHKNVRQEGGLPEGGWRGGSTCMKFCCEPCCMRICWSCCC